MSESKLVRFVGFSSKLTVNLSAGTVLLDATADVDGVSHIVPWRTAVEVPQARYDNLEIVHVPQHTTRQLKGYLKTAANRRSYVEWMEQTILEQMAPEERGSSYARRYSSIMRASLAGLTAMSASKARRVTQSTMSGTWKVGSSARSTGERVSAAINGKTPTWCSCSMSSLSRVGFPPQKCRATEGNG